MASFLARLHARLRDDGWFPRLPAEPWASWEAALAFFPREAPPMQRLHEHCRAELPREPGLAAKVLHSLESARAYQIPAGTPTGRALWEELGGREGLQRIVKLWLALVHQDPELRRVYSSTVVSRQIFGQNRSYERGYLTVLEALVLGRLDGRFAALAGEGRFGVAWSHHDHRATCPFAGHGRAAAEAAQDKSVAWLDPSVRRWHEGGQCPVDLAGSHRRVQHRIGPALFDLHLRMLTTAVLGLGGSPGSARALLRALAELRGAVVGAAPARDVGAGPGVDLVLLKPPSEDTLRAFVEDMFALIVYDPLFAHADHEGARDKYFAQVLALSRGRELPTRPPSAARVRPRVLREMVALQKHAVEAAKRHRLPLRLEAALAACLPEIQTPDHVVRENVGAWRRPTDTGMDWWPIGRASASPTLSMLERPSTGWSTSPHAREYNFAMLASDTSPASMLADPRYRSPDGTARPSTHEHARARARTSTLEHAQGPLSDQPQRPTTAPGEQRARSRRLAARP